MKDVNEENQCLWNEFFGRENIDDEVDGYHLRYGQEDTIFMMEYLKDTYNVYATQEEVTIFWENYSSYLHAGWLVMGEGQFESALKEMDVRLMEAEKENE